MCTVVILRRPGDAWPVIIGANRDEMDNRPWKPPARHWPDRADVMGGLDILAGGTWIGLNDQGVAACILNGYQSLGPAPGKRSRGELVLEALDHADASEAAKFLADIDPAAYRPFNMLIADNRDAFWLAARKDVRGAWVETKPVPEGISMLTAGDMNDPADARIARFRPQFEAAAAPEPDKNNWVSWQKLLGSTDGGGAVFHAMSFKIASGFGTTSSSLVALPSVEAAHAGTHPIWWFAAGAPESAPFLPVDISDT